MISFSLIEKVLINFSGKIAFKLISTNFLREKYVQNKHKGNKTKTNSMKPKLLKKLPVGPLISSIGAYN